MWPLLTLFFHKLWFKIQNGSQSFLWDFMVADNSNSVFSVHPQESYSNTRFLISGLKKTCMLHLQALSQN